MGEESTREAILAYRDLFVGGDGNLRPSAETALDDLMEIGGVLRPASSMVGGRFEPYLAGRADGRREVALRIVRAVYPSETDRELWRQWNAERRFGGSHERDDERPGRRRGGRLV